jgi:hypothetical protein
VSVKGYYCLALECDAPSCNQAEDFSAMNDEIITKSRYESLEIARGRGWMIAHNKSGKCWCPACCREAGIALSAAD